MQEKIIEFLKCPVSNESLELTVFERGNLGKASDHILEGILKSSSMSYPIIKGVPRLLKPDLLNNTLKNYPDFIEKHKEHFPDIEKNETKNLKTETQDSFGLQWNLFPEMFEVWDSNFREYFYPKISVDDFNQKYILDCGCGFGRHLYYSAKYGAKEVIGVDLSHAVDSAVLNVSEFPNAHVVQGEIYNLPVKANFDLAYTIGVLQHLPDPLEAFKSIASQIKVEGEMYAWVYGKRPMSYHLVVDNMRKFTTTMNRHTLHKLTKFLAYLSFTGLALPRRFLEAIGLNSLGKKVPFSRYAEFPFQVSHADWFDRLAAPKTVYFSKEETDEFIKASNLQEHDITFREGGSWKVWGKRKS